jgi:hypothetical protein
MSGLVRTIRNWAHGGVLWSLIVAGLSVALAACTNGGGAGSGY